MQFNNEAKLIYVDSFINSRYTVNFSIPSSLFFLFVIIIHFLVTVICHVVAWWSYVWRHLLGLLGVTSYVRLLNCCMGHHLNSFLLKKSYQPFSGYEHILIIKLWIISFSLIKNIYKQMRHSFIVSISFVFPSEVTDGWTGRVLNLQDSEHSKFV